MARDDVHPLLRRDHALLAPVWLAAALAGRIRSGIILLRRTRHRLMAGLCRMRSGTWELPGAGWELRRGVWVPGTLAAEAGPAPFRRAQSWRIASVQRAWGRVGRKGVFGLAMLAVGIVPFTEALDVLAVRMIDRCREIEVCNPLPPPVLVGTLSEVRIGAANVTQAQAAAERGRGMPPSHPHWPGRLVTYRAEFRGFGETECTVTWTLFDAHTGERVEDGSGPWQTVHAHAFPDQNWRVQAAQEDVNIGLIWVPHVAAGRFVVEVELRDENGIHLDLERTEAFTVLAVDVHG